MTTRDIGYEIYHKSNRDVKNILDELNRDALRRLHYYDLDITNISGLLFEYGESERPQYIYGSSSDGWFRVIPDHHPDGGYSAWSYDEGGYFRNYYYCGDMSQYLGQRWFSALLWGIVNILPLLLLSLLQHVLNIRHQCRTMAFLCFK